MCSNCRGILLFSLQVINLLEIQDVFSIFISSLFEWITETREKTQTVKEILWFLEIYLIWVQFIYRNTLYEQFFIIHSFTTFCFTSVPQLHVGIITECDACENIWLNNLQNVTLCAGSRSPIAFLLNCVRVKGYNGTFTRTKHVCLCVCIGVRSEWAKCN